MRELDCPPWCTGEHENDVVPARWVHESPSWRVPCVIPYRDMLSGGVHQDTEVVELDVLLERQADFQAEWVVISGERGALVLSVESAHRLQDALEQVLRL